MSKDAKAPVIIVKRGKKHKHDGGHGGSWKIAYADFVTAMMAFFMLMWLLSLLNKYQLQGVAQYFQRPVADIFSGNKKHDYEKVTAINPEVREDNTQDTINMIYPINMPNVNKEAPEVVGRSTEPGGLGPLTKEAYQEDLHGVQQSKNVPSEGSEAFISKEDSTSHSAPESGQAGSETQKNDLDQATEMQHQLEMKLMNNPELKAYKDNLNFTVTEDGLKISLHDTSDSQLFELGNAQLKTAAQKMVGWLSGQFNGLSQKILIIGHTDGLQYQDAGDFSNWELSTDRANAARQLLVQSGMHPDKVLRIQGAGDSNLYDKNNPYNPMNRRVDIIILTDKAEKRIENE
jgi:chemotaxis protein MotB